MKEENANAEELNEEHIKVRKLQDALPDFNNKPIQIFVKGLKGETITLNVSEGTTVQEFKSKVEVETDIAPEQQRLIIGGKQLEDGKIEDYGLRHESTLHLVLRLDGGGNVQKAEQKKKKKVKKNKVSFFRAFSFLDTSVQISLSRYDVAFSLHSLSFFFWTPVSKLLSISDVAFSLCLHPKGQLFHCWQNCWKEGERPGGCSRQEEDESSPSPAGDKVPKGVLCRAWTNFVPRGFGKDAELRGKKDC